ncbi:hypothetical protein CLU79DRAFT_843161 [Phycomyces nitens]|nr:hypothetical protein CLU79DRAFT_843161 [Phycomyces nitens]
MDQLSNAESHHEPKNEEEARQDKNLEEVDQLKSHTRNDSENPNLKKAPGNTLDAAGNIHTTSGDSQRGTQETGPGTAILPDPPGPSTPPKDCENYGSGDASLGQEINQVHKTTLRTPKPTKTIGKEQALKHSSQLADPADNPRHHSFSFTPDVDSLLTPIDPGKLIAGLEINALKYITATCIICYVCGRLDYNIFFGIFCAVLAVLIFWLVGKEMKKGLGWKLAKQEGMKSLYTSEGETVEWLNFMVEKIWRSIDPEFFVLVEGMLQDTLESIQPNSVASIKKFIKVKDLDIGVQAPRIQSIRVFPSLPGQPDESIFGEASFSFHAHPSASFSGTRHATAKSPGISIQLKAGIDTPINVRAELVAFSGKIRFKVLTSPEIPFVSKVTLAFTRNPVIETAIMPLTKHFNIMHLPMVKALVNQGISLGFAEFVDPKSITLDIQELMGADATDVRAIGVVKVEIREASRLGSQTIQDMEDSYATLSLSNQPKKTLSSTRVLTNDKDPRWNETLYVLVNEGKSISATLKITSPDDILADTKVDIKVWDADKVKYDDLWGSVSIPVKSIVQGQVDKIGNVSDWCKEERVVFDGWEPIDGKSEAKSKTKLNYKLSFHPKYTLPKADLLHGGAQKDNGKDTKPEHKQKEEPLNPSHNNGILSIQVHQAVDLEIADPEVIAADENKHPYNPNQIVSPYAIIYINDNKVFKTRTKMRNPSPHWNAVSENFVADYENATIRISVKNSVDLERDPVIGTKSIALSELFADQKDTFKDVQKWIPLDNGIGFGKVLLTIKYKPVKLTLPRELQGSDVATLVVDYVSLSNLKPPFDPKYINSTKVVLALNLDPVIVKRLKPKDMKQQQDSEEMVSQNEIYGWWHQHLYFPLSMRYRTALYVHVHQGTITATKASGRIWLKNLVDQEWHDIVVGLHPYCSEKSKESNRNQDDWDMDGELGQVTLRVKVMPGFSPVHTHLHSYKKDMVGADPFHDDAIKAKAQQWIHEQSADNNDTTADPELKEAVQQEREKKEDIEEMKQGRRRSSSMSSEYGEDDSDMEDKDYKYMEEMRSMFKSPKIRRNSVSRKLAWCTDKAKNKVDSIRDGFNSEARAAKNVTKEG